MSDNAHVTMDQLLALMDAFNNHDPDTIAAGFQVRGVDLKLFGHAIPLAASSTNILSKTLNRCRLT